MFMFFTGKDFVTNTLGNIDETAGKWKSKDGKIKPIAKFYNVVIVWYTALGLFVDDKSGYFSCVEVSSKV